jgi:Cytochrome bd terminal oxidase subunit I
LREAALSLLDLSRWQFAITVLFHITFPSITVGLSIFLCVLYGLYWKTGNPTATPRKLGRSSGWRSSWHSPWRRASSASCSTVTAGSRGAPPNPEGLLINEPTTGLDASTGTHVLMAIRRRVPLVVLVLVMHELPADPDVLGLAWSTLSLD